MSATSTRTVLAVGSASNLFYVLAVQAMGLVCLSPSRFGYFSIQYLIGALAASACLSAVAETWMREELLSGDREPWQRFSNAALFLSAAGGAVTLLVSLAVAELRPVAVQGAAAVALVTYRGATRFHDVRLGRVSRAIVGDVLGGVVALCVPVAVAVSGHQVGLGTITAAWVFAGAVPLLIGRRPARPRVHEALAWVRNHRSSIALLVRDSVITDLGGIGTPLLLGPLLGISELGIYRAMSNAAAPVRLVVTPLRPALAHLPAARIVRGRYAAAVVLLALSAGLACWGLLTALRAFAPTIGTLTALAAYAPAAGLFVGGTLLLHVFSMFARTNLGGHALLGGRLVQLVLCLGLPTGLALTAGLGPVLWGYATATLVSGLSWAVILTWHVARPTPS